MPRILREDVERQRPLAGVYVVGRLLERLVGLDRQDRPEDLLLSQGQVIGRIEHQKHRQLAR